MEKKTKSTGKTIVIVIMTILLIAAVGYIGYDKLLVKEDSTSENNTQDITTNTSDSMIV